MNEYEKAWRSKIPYDIIIHCIRPYLTLRRCDCYINEGPSIIYLNKEIYNNSLRYISPCLGYKHLRVDNKLVCPKKKYIQYKLLKDFMEKKINEDYEGKKKVHISYSFEDLYSSAFRQRNKFVKGFYHPSEEIVELIKELNGGIYGNTTLRHIFTIFQVFHETNYEIYYLCCNGRGMRYRRRIRK